MNATRMKLKRAGTGIIKTYGKCNVRKVELQTWLSPNSKDRLFSSTTSFEASANDVDSCDSDFLPSKRIRKNVAAPSGVLRPLNKRGKTPVKKKLPNHADFEKCRRVLRERNKNKENLVQKWQSFAPAGEEKENDAFQRKFVTERRKHHPLPGSVAVNRRRDTRKNKKALLAADTLGSSSEFLTSPAHVVNFRKKNTKRRCAAFAANLSSQLAYSHMKTRKQNYKRPLLCSTPSVVQKSNCITKDPSISEISCTDDLEDSDCRKVENGELLCQNQMFLTDEKITSAQKCHVEGYEDVSLPGNHKSVSLCHDRISRLESSISTPLNTQTRKSCAIGSIDTISRDAEARHQSLRSVKCKVSSCSRNEIVTGTEMSGSRELFSDSVICLKSSPSLLGDKCTALPSAPLTAAVQSNFHELERKRAELVQLCTSVKTVIKLSPVNVHKALHNEPALQNSSGKGKSVELWEPASTKEYLDVDCSLPSVKNYDCAETERKILELKELCTTVQPFVLLENVAVDARKSGNKNATESSPFTSDMQHERTRVRTRLVRRDSKKLCTKLFPNHDESSDEIKDCKAGMCVKQDEELQISSNSMEFCCPQPSEPLCPTVVQCGIPEKETEFKEAIRKSEEHLNHDFGDKLAPYSIQSKVLKPKVTSALKEGTGTARKACISGFSSSRWGKRAKTKQFSKNSHLARSKKDPDFSLLDRHHNEKKRKVFECIPRGDVLRIFTPGTKQKAGLQGSFLCSPSPSNCPLELSQLLSSRGWSRLKASLSVHKKKRVVPTPSHLKRMGLRDVVRSGFSTPQRGTPGFLHRQDIYAGTPCDDLIGPSPSHELSFMGALTPLRSPSILEDITDAEKVFRECQQDGPISFEECIPPKKLKQCVKIGEGVFGEVFRSVNDKNESVALKIIPIEGQDIVNGESQKTFDSILPEIIISKELSCLTDENIYRTVGFVTLHSVHCVKGSYPSQLLKAWDKYDKAQSSENDRPDFFGEEQLFIVLEFEFGGSDLEHMKYKLSSAATLLSILHQVTASLAVAEESLKFEHRDLHWGNVLVKTTDLKEVKYILNGTEHAIMTRGVKTSIIDYTLSRLEKDGLTVFCDMSADEDLFKGEGDYQFDIYRKMREENLNSWIEYNSHSNVLWLHYITDKLLNEIVLKSKPRTAPMKAIWKKIKAFYSEVRTFSSAAEVLQCSQLFQ